MSSELHDANGLVEQFQRLRRSHLRLKIGVVCLTVLAPILLYVTHTSLNWKLITQLVIVTDSKDHARWVISGEGDSGGRPILLLRDERNRVRFHFTEDEVKWFDEDERPRVSLVLKPESPIMRFYDADGKVTYSAPVTH